MKGFTDNLGRTWTITVNIGAVKRVRGLCDGVDILDLISFDEKEKKENSLLERLSTDPVLLVDVLYAVCKPEADQRNVSDEEFGNAMAGDAIEEASKALLQEIVDFFPAAKRKVLQKMLDVSRRYEETAMQNMNRVVDSGKLDEAIALQLQKLNGISPSVPESSDAAIQTP